MSILMKCGHTAQGICSRRNGVDINPPIPACVICDCFESDPAPPSLEGRLARCSYYGSTPRGRLHEGPCKRGTPCKCEELSSFDLAFFEYRAGALYDTFYCGCWGWD